MNKMYICEVCKKEVPAKHCIKISLQGSAWSCNVCIDCDEKQLNCLLWRFLTNQNG
jgi:hypothetical protein